MELWITRVLLFIKSVVLCINILQNVDIRKNSHEYLIKLTASYQQFFGKKTEKTVRYSHFVVDNQPEKS